MALSQATMHGGNARVLDSQLRRSHNQLIHSRRLVAAKRSPVLRAAVEPTTVVSSLDLSPTSTVESSVDETVQSSGREALSRLGIPQVPAEQLFDAAHVQEWTPLLLAYFPVGCLLGVIRMAAWIGGIALDASWFRNKAVVDAYMALLGVTVVWEGEENIPSERHVLVSNHISTADLLMLFQRPHRYAHLITTALPQKVYACQHLPAILQPADKRTYLSIADSLTQQQQQQPTLDAAQHQHGPGMPAGLQLTSSSSEAGPSLHSLHAAPVSHQHAQQLHSSISTSSVHARQQAAVGQSPQQQQQQHQPSVHLFPEGGMTNGKAMMRFSRGFMMFADKLPVVPVALRIRCAFPQINSHTIDSNFLVNLFWCSFQPWTVMEAKALPAMQLAPGESKAAFVQRVQLAIAEDLRVWIADLNIQQKRQLAGKQQKPAKQLKQRAR